jgi:Flp pilus assembly protein TadD
LSRIILTLLAAGFLFSQTSEYDQGLALFQHGDAAAAVPHFRRAVAAEPRNALAWKGLGAALAAQKEYAAAEPAFRMACQLDAKLPDACYFLGRALYALNRFNDSLSALERADQANWRVRLAIAQSADGMGDSALSDREFREAVAQCKGRDVEAATDYGLVLVRQGRGGDAIPVLEEALKHHPQAPEAQTCLGRVLLEAGRTAAAIPHLERAVELAPESAQAHLLLAKAYVRAGRTREAQPHFDAAAKYGIEK